jgi:hypothetical protein
LLTHRFSVISCSGKNKPVPRALNLRKPQSVRNDVQKL